MINFLVNTVESITVNLYKRQTSLVHGGAWWAIGHKESDTTERLHDDTRDKYAVFNAY